MLKNLKIVLSETRFPENIGSAARASANFGHAPIVLVNPERWDREKALPLATAQGAPLLDSITVTKNLPEALSDCSLVVGTTARTGGWRRELLTPRKAAAEIARRISEGERAAIVFGPEDRGLSNADLESCQRLVRIPTAPDSSSLNLGQAALLMLYEVFLALPDAGQPHAPGALSRRIRADERELLHKTLKEILLNINFLHAGNPDYFFLPLARFLDRADVRRHEMDMLMGICRQIRNHGKQE